MNFLVQVKTGKSFRSGVRYSRGHTALHASALAAATVWVNPDETDAAGNPAMLWADSSAAAALISGVVTVHPRELLTADTVESFLDYFRQTVLALKLVEAIAATRDALTQKQCIEKLLSTPTPASVRALVGALPLLRGDALDFALSQLPAEAAMDPAKVLDLQDWEPILQNRRATERSARSHHVRAVPWTHVSDLPIDRFVRRAMPQDLLLRAVLGAPSGKDFAYRVTLLVQRVPIAERLSESEKAALMSSALQHSDLPPDFEDNFREWLETDPLQCPFQAFEQRLRKGLRAPVVD